MKSYLTNSQKEALDKFSKLKVGALFMEMGSGKTLTAIELIKFNVGKFDKVIWFTPVSTIENLRKEINKWTDIEIEIFGWETLSQSDRQYLELLSNCENKRLFIVADESSLIKNSETKRYQRLMQIAKFSDYRLVLTGTPITKSEWDLYYQMQFLSPKIINMSESEFLQNFFTHVKYKKRGQKPNEFYKLSDINIDYLHKLIDPYTINVKFEFENEEINIVQLVEPTTETIEQYKEIKNNALDNLVAMNSETIIMLLQKLNLISSLDANKNELLAEHIENKQVICFVQFKEELQGITRHLKDFYVITGETPKRVRESIINEFKSNSKPLIMTLGVGAFGLNLQFCNEIVFSSLTFDYAKILQAKGRIRRLGQESDINYTYFDINLPINNFISKNIDNKEELHATLIKYLKEN